MTTPRLRNRKAARDIGPPWVLFVDKGKPIAILPAMRPGEVASVRHLTMKEANRIVRLANALGAALVEAQLGSLTRELMAITAEILCDPNVKVPE